MNNEKFEPVRLRIMKEAYNLEDRGDSEGYNAIKVMCDEIQKMLKREWVGLTRNEVLDIEERAKHPLEFYRNIEDKLKEKNT